MDGTKTLSNPKLFQLFQEVLAQWTFLGAEFCEPETKPAGSLLEYMVRLDGPVPATLVIRCNRSAAKLMAESATGEDAVDDAAAADAFKELVNVVFGHLASSYLKRNGGPFSPFMPMPSSPRDWPPTAPTHRCVAAVEDQLIELLVWNEARTPSLARQGAKP